MVRTVEIKKTLLWHVCILSLTMGGGIMHYKHFYIYSLNDYVLFFSKEEFISKTLYAWNV